MRLCATCALLAAADKGPVPADAPEAVPAPAPPLISAATLLEVNIVMLNRHGVKAARMVERLLQQGGFQIESFTAQHAEIARDAYARYGKGQQSAGLNYGDCFSYALAKATGLPLLFKAQDFSKTDITPVELNSQGG